MAYATFIPPLVNEPPQAPLPDPAADPSWYGEIWVRYPATGTPIPTFHPQSFHVFSRFCIILNEIALASFSKSQPNGMPLEQCFRFYERLRIWFAELPSCLGTASAVLPYQLKIQYVFCQSA
jgi:hypothetical protein